MKRTFTSVRVDPCWNCERYGEYPLTEYCQFCVDHNHCSYKYNPSIPLYTFKEAKEKLLECAHDLAYECETPEEINEVANKIYSIIYELDKMKGAE